MQTSKAELSLEMATLILNAAVEKACSLGVLVNIAVLDAGTNLKGFFRMDGALLGSIDVAMKKARTARLFDMESGEMGTLSKPGGPLYGIDRSNGGLITFAGGVPIKSSAGEIIGAIGVSGSTVENDRAVALAGAMSVPASRRGVAPSEPHVIPKLPIGNARHHWLRPMNTPTSQTSGNHEDYDLLVLGSGEGGKFAAWALAKTGQRVAVIERKYIGGSCPNIACLPSKNLIHSAKVASLFGRGREFGMMTSDFKIDMSAVRERKRQMVAGLVEMHLHNFEASGTELILGSGQFVAPKTIQVTSADGKVRLLRGKAIIISTGSRARVEPLPGLIKSAPLTHVELLELDVVPKHLIVLGGGYVGLELAQAMRRLGSDVTIIERSARILPREDEDVSDALLQLCRDEGIRLVLKSSVKRVEGTSGEAVKLFVTDGSVETLVEGTHVLIASGRTPNTAGIGLELAGVKIDERGHIQVNERLETTAPDVFAVGDCAGSPHFTHVAFDDYRIVRDNLAGGNRVTTYRQLPFCLYTDPEFARIGLSETEAKNQGILYRLARIPMAAALRTRTLSETRGFMKALVAVDSDRILGLTVFGVGAGEIIAVVQVAMLASLPYTALRDAVFTHPTLPEGLVSLFSAVTSSKPH